MNRHCNRIKLQLLAAGYIYLNFFICALPAQRPHIADVKINPAVFMFIIISDRQRNVGFFTYKYKTFTKPGKDLFVGDGTVEQCKIKVFRETVIIEIDFF